MHSLTGRDIAADLLVVGIGAVPVTGLAEAAGLAVENGIAVDRYLRTADPRHLRGRRLLLVSAATSMADAAYGWNPGATRRIRVRWRQKTCSGRESRCTAVPWFWSDQHDLTLQIAGLAEGAERHVRRDLGDGAFILFHLAPDGRLLAASGIGQGNAVARDIKLAEMLIAKGARPDPAALASAEVRLKSLLAGG